MVVVDQWTGASACLLQAALRATNESFAHSLGIAVRTVAAWHAEPGLVPRAEVQAILDTALEHAPASAVERFAALVANGRPDTATGGPQPLTVAVAVVRRDTGVLLVRRRGEDATGLHWQFPAGVVKPGAQADTVAVSETLAETGVHVAVTRSLGERVHPLTGALCRYLLCDYLTGAVRNADPVENAAATWAPVATLGRFIPPDTIYPPILEALESSHD